jgi:hypothetical protein
MRGREDIVWVYLLQRASVGLDVGATGAKACSLSCCLVGLEHLIIVCTIHRSCINWVASYINFDYGVLPS